MDRPKAAVDFAVKNSGALFTASTRWRCPIRSMRKNRLPHNGKDKPTRNSLPIEASGKSSPPLSPWGRGAGVRGEASPTRSPHPCPVAHGAPPSTGERGGLFLPFALVRVSQIFDGG